MIQDCRGRGKSEGEFFYDRSEAQDGFTTIEWVAQLPGSTGRVGMYGFSYVGYVQLLAATLRPPSLRAIAPGFIYGRMFDAIYNGGAFALGITAAAAVGHALEIARREGNDEAFQALRKASTRLPMRTRRYRSTTTRLYGRRPGRLCRVAGSPDLRRVLASHSVSDDYSRIAVPALHIGGWYDVCLRGTLQNFLGLRAEAGRPRRSPRTEAARRSLVPHAVDRP